LHSQQFVGAPVNAAHSDRHWDISSRSSASSQPFSNDHRFAAPSGFAPASSMQVMLGIDVGIGVGIAVGIAVGLAVGIAVGIAVGLAVGIAVGIAVGMAVGIAVGGPR